MGDVVTVGRTRRARPNVDLQPEEFHGTVLEYKSRAAEPIKDLDAIEAVHRHLVEQGRLRDNLLFVMGINFGLRCGDLTQLQVANVVDENGELREEIVLQEQKTGKIRRVYMNDAVADALILYFGGREVNLNSYLFTSRSPNNCKKYYDTLASKVKLDGKSYNIKGFEGKGIRVESVSRILKETINRELDMDVHASSHCLRKTFAYHVLTMAEDRIRALEKLQLLFGHADQRVTLHYAGITDDEIRGAYNMNLAGGKRGIYMNFPKCMGLRATGEER